MVGPIFNKIWCFVGSSLLVSLVINAMLQKMGGGGGGGAPEVF